MEIKDDRSTNQTYKADRTKNVSFTGEFSRSEAKDELLSWMDRIDDTSIDDHVLAVENKKNLNRKDVTILTPQNNTNSKCLNEPNIVSYRLDWLIAAQLITEYLIIIFAISLLLLAGAIILNVRMPILMESSEVIPKIMFVLCAIVAICSFVRWIIRKVHQQFLDSSRDRTYELTKHKIDP